MENYTFKTKKWLYIALINFCVVALAGVTLRYKINFSLPFINQKYLLHAHSHFAFTGWVTLALMSLMVNYLMQHSINANYKKYHLLLLANCITAYGMLFSFLAEGYAFFSITFSTLSIFISYFFIFFFWRDLRKVNNDPYTPVWFKTALILWAFSSLGAFTLAYLMANQIMVQDYYFGAAYFFMHFQYNGWFLFSCFGLLLSHLYQKGFSLSTAFNKKQFIIMAVTVGPTYFLSLLWLKLPKTLIWAADISGVLQLLVLYYFTRLLPLVKNNIQKLASVTRYLWIMAYIAFIIKIILQMLSIIPFLSQYAFGFRPIVIGYLHLSFLGIISFFLLGYINQILNEINVRISTTGVIIFVIGVLVQEVVLMGQGLEVMEFEPLPYAKIILFYAAITMGIGLIWITVNLKMMKRLRR